MVGHMVLVHAIGVRLPAPQHIWKYLLADQILNWELFENDFERVIHTTYPKIGLIKTTLQNAGALYAGLSGSGSTVFGVFDNLQKAKYVLEQFDQYQTFLTSPVFR